LPLQEYMRVIAGALRGRNLKSSDSFRPTTDRVRETLFNILQNQIENSNFVDAFAGSGAVGIEALSRGAARVYFVETNHKALKTIEDNLKLCGDDALWRIYSLPAIKGLEVIQKAGDPADIIFFDPPYDYKDYPELISAAAELFPNALLVLETSSRSKFKLSEDVTLIRQKKIGETLLTFCQKA
jgi:16S rRNA (guanine966-N2)-methyltransferase